MVFDSLKNAALYYGANPLFEYAFDFAMSLAEPSTPMGRYDGEGGVYVMKSTYNTKVCEVATYEAHKEYIDLQILLVGKEKILDCDLDGIDVTKPYEPDYLLGTAKEGTAEQTLILGSDDFAIFYPTDAHAPGLAVGESSAVIKLVAKIPVKD